MVGDDHYGYIYIYGYYGYYWLLWLLLVIIMGSNKPQIHQPVSPHSHGFLTTSLPPKGTAIVHQSSTVQG